MTTETRNYYLEQILTAEGGTPTPEMSMIDLLNAIVIAAGGVVTKSHDRNSLLDDYLVAKGGARTGLARNKIIEAIITQLGGSPSSDETRNKLLILWEATI